MHAHTCKSHVLYLDQGQHPGMLLLPPPTYTYTERKSLARGMLRNLMAPEAVGAGREGKEAGTFQKPTGPLYTRMISREERVHIIFKRAVILG